MITSSEARNQQREKLKISQKYGNKEHPLKQTTSQGNHKKNEKIPCAKFKHKCTCDIMKPMGCSKCSTQREIYSHTLYTQYSHSHTYVKKEISQINNFTP